MDRRLRGLTLFLIIGLFVSLFPASASAAPAARYFPPTGHWVEGSFLSFFDRHGGLDLFGYPRTEPLWRDGHLVQYFQRARFESWPNNPPPFDVQLGLLGDEVTGPADKPIPAAEVPAAGDPSRAYFPQTGHTLSGAFRTFFDNHGGLAIFGYPISEAEMGPSGFLIQRFQRARMEWHPELPAAYQVSLGLIGDEAIFVQGQVTMAATVPVSSVAPPDAAPLPSGRILVETSPGGNLVEAQPDGRDSRTVGVGFDPSWSPDGSRIAFTTLGPTGGVFVENADGTGRKQVYLGDGARSPVWSPDGQSIAFYRKYRGYPLRTVNGVVQYDDFFQVVVIRLSDDSTWLPMEQPSHSFSPSWAPDGSNLIFQGDLGIYIVSTTQIARRIPNTNRNFTTPAYSPDGQTIAFTYWNADHWDIGEIRPDGSSMRLLTYDSTLSPPANNASAAWTPDGSGLAFVSDRSGSWQLYLMSADGSGVRPLNGIPLTYTGGFARVIAWTK